MPKQAVLLVNLGSPDSTSVPDVRRYLDEFLSDDRVIDIPKPIQQFVLKCFILPKRPKKSAHAYESVWLPEGSPLVVTTRNVQKLLQAKVEVPIALAMRYGNPSIASMIGQLAADGVNDLLLVPLYPHYAMSSFETVVVKVQEEVRKQAPQMKLTTVQPFYNEPDYIEALYQNSKPYLDRGYDYLLFSFHSIPERHLRKGDPSKAHCTKVPDCCRTCSPVHAVCYRAQTVATTDAFVRRAGIPDGKWSISFQSRLAGEPWVQPYTDLEIERLAKSGVKKLMVISPAFVSDCLETIEEIGMGGKENFLEHGGKEYELIPCLNEHPLWIEFLESKVRNWQGQHV
jgi:protoporphyrin/coproporphyrin ferrochelatase